LEPFQIPAGKSGLGPNSGRRSSITPSQFRISRCHDLGGKFAKIFL
jgi:hypothetical protein